MSSKTSKLTLVPTQPPIQGVQGALSRGKKKPGHEAECGNEPSGSVKCGEFLD